MPGILCPEIELTGHIYSGPGGIEFFWISRQVIENNGVGDGNWTHNRRNHTPLFCQLSYTHLNQVTYSNIKSEYLQLLLIQYSPYFLQGRGVLGRDRRRGRNRVSQKIDSPSLNFWGPGCRPVESTPIAIATPTPRGNQSRARQNHGWSRHEHKSPRW